ncbi:unnamed protein product [Schistosoma mattheei]|uniref:Phosphatidylinositol transfer protein N-terminal domain-containing protein n=1 Tax=Schistosoma mattheei TaxID=31246 RepID=A0A183NMX7_9TREM|nr:unnamed protein product [Schistosoma mattheei]
MLLKEYRICMPLTVAEYRIAQLYMIQKKSREESTGRGSGVEILKNEPYENGPGGKGQYTFKIYHVGSHLPSKSYVSESFGPKLLAFFTGHLLNTNLMYFTYYLRCIQAISEI